MSRRGTIKQDPESGLWGFVVETAPLGAPRKQLRRRGFRTKREAQAELTKLTASIDGGAFVEPSKLTVAEYLETWLVPLARYEVHSQVTFQAATSLLSM